MMTYDSDTTIASLVEHEAPDADAGLRDLLEDTIAAVTAIAAAVRRGSLAVVPRPGDGPRSTGELALALAEHAFAVGRSGARATPASPGRFVHREHVLFMSPLEGAAELEVGVAGGTIFSVFRGESDAPRPGAAQVCAGYAVYGPATMVVVSVGKGAHGFTLDAGGELRLSHPLLAIPAATRAVVFEAANERLWEPPLERYLNELLAGPAGPRAADFDVRRVTSMVAEVHRLLLRGGVFIYPHDTHGAGRRLVDAANPLAMLVEQAGGLASTGRERVLEVVPQHEDECTAFVMGSRDEVLRVIRYHDEYDRGLEAFHEPLLATRSLSHASWGV